MADEKLKSIEDLCGESPQMAQVLDAAQSRFSANPWNGVRRLGPDFRSFIPQPRESLMQDALGEMFMPLGVVAMISGAGGVGKSLWELLLAISVVTGCLFLERFRPSRTGAALLVFAEDDFDEIMRRFFACLPGLKLTAEMERLLENLFIRDCPGTRLQLLEKGGPTECFKGLLSWAKAQNQEFRLIVLDPLTKFMAENVETDNQVASEFVSLIARLTQLPGHPTVLLSHHVSKFSLTSGNRTQTAARGSGALVAESRWAASLFEVGELDKGSKVIKVDGFKVNYQRKPKPFNVVLECEDTVPERVQMRIATSKDIKDAKTNAKKANEDNGDCSSGDRSPYA